MKINKFNLVVYLIFIIGLLLRLYYMIHPESIVSMDESTYALQAYRIFKGSNAVFFPNQAYTGTLSAYLASFLFNIFGISLVWVKFVPFVFSLGFMVTIYLLAKEVFANKYISLLSLLFISFSSPFWINWTTRAGTGYPEMMFFGNILLIITLKIVYKNLRPNREGLYFFFWGVCAGLGYWIQPTIVYYLLPSLVFLFFWRPLFFLRPTFWLGILGFGIGSMPVIIWNIQNQNLTNRSLFHKPFGVRKAMTEFFTVGLPIIFGVRKPFSVQDFFTPLALLIESIYIAAFGFLVYTKARLLQNSKLGKFATDLIRGKSLINYLEKTDILLLNFFFIFLVFSLSSPFNQFVVEPRYISAVYTPLSVLLGYFAYQLYKWKKYIGVAIITALVVNSVYALYKVPAESFVTQYKTDELIGYLDNKGVTYVIGEFDFAYRLSFETRERIIVTPSDNLFGAHRFVEYIDMVEKAPTDKLACVFVFNKVESCLSHFGEDMSKIDVTMVGPFKVISQKKL